MHDEPILPPEILENIVEFCSPDKDTLRKLSLVSTTCLALARRQLFAEITINPPEPDAFIGAPNIFRIPSISTRFVIPSGPFFIGDSPCAKFLDILNPSTQTRSRLGTVAKFVRHLYLREGSGMSSWIATDPSLPPLLRALSNLLSFRLSPKGSIPLLWAKVPLLLQDTIVRYVLSQSTLTGLRLSRLAFHSLKQVNGLLGSCRGLRTLEVDHSGVQEEGELEETSGSVEKAALDTLILGPCTPTLLVRSLSRPSCPIRVDTICKLCLSIPGSFSEFAGLLRASTSLDTLELVLTSQLDITNYWALPPSEQLDLSKLPSLCDFRITFNVLQRVGDLLEWLTAILQTAIDQHMPAMMKNLSVVFALFVTGLRLDHLIDSFSGWRNVDAVLCGDGQTPTRAYSNLKRVNLKFILNKAVNLTFAPRFMAELELDSPGLRERGLLSIDAVDR